MCSERRKPGNGHRSESAEEYRRREGEVRFRLMAEKAIDMMSHHTADGTYLYVSPAGKLLLGWEPEEMIGVNAYEFIHPDDHKFVRTSHDTILTKPTVYTVQYRIRRKDRTYIWFETNSTVIRDEASEEISEIVAVSRDITRRKQYEQALQDSETRLKAAQALGKLGNWELNVADNSMIWSDEVYHLFERPKNGGQPSFEESLKLLHPDDAVLLQRRLREAVESGRESQLDVRVVLPSGQTKNFSGLIRVVKDDDGRVIRLFGTVQDITDRKRVEQALADANRALKEDQEALQRKNTALREVLDQIESERQDVAEQISTNVERMVMPLLTQLENRVGATNGDLIDLVRDALRELTSPFMQRLKGLAMSLSPREMEICQMIKNGLSSKDIAATLSTSEGTVRNQRKSIRRKLGIDSEQINLRLYLQTLEEMTGKRPRSR